MTKDQEIEDSLSSEQRLERAFVFAVRRGDVAQAEQMLQAGLDVELSDGAGWTLLMSASYYGCYPIVEKLLELGAKSDAVTSTSARTALQLAAGEHHYKIVELLLSAGASVDKSDSQGGTPLTRALEKVPTERESFLKTLEALLQVNPDPRIKNSGGLDALKMLEMLNDDELRLLFQQYKVG